MSPPRRLSSVSMGFAAAALVSTALRAAEPSPSLTLDVLGGDAWTFEKHISGRVVTGECDEVIVRSPGSEAHSLRLQQQEFVARVPLQSGDNTVQAVCRNGGLDVAYSEGRLWTVRLRAAPHAWARTQISADGIALDALGTERSPGLPAPLTHYEWWAAPGNPAPLVLASGGRSLDSHPAEGVSIELRKPARDGEYRVMLRASDSLGRDDESSALFRVEQGEPVEVDTASDHPAWVDSAVMYGVALPLFGPDAFAAVAKRLDAIAALGVTTLWLSPVTEAPDKDFGYAVTDPFRLRGNFGSESRFRALIDGAHARGLRVLLDFVVNHFSDRHPYFADAERHGRASAYYDWFERDAAGQPVHYFDWTRLENLNYDNPEVRAYLIAALSWWIRTYHVDGFRIDASWTLRQRVPRFWPAVRTELERIDPDIFLLAEASARDAYYVHHGFDAEYDWTSQLGEWAWHDVFGPPGTLPDLGRLRAALTNDGRGFPDRELVLHFLNNNDTGERFVTRHGAGQTRVAAALLFTLPGIPLIYDGDEVGAAFEPYRSGVSIRWRDRYGFTALYERLAKVRRDLPALRSRQLELVSTDHDEAVLAYVRPGEGCGEEDILTLLNFGAQPLDVRLAGQGGPENLHGPDRHPGDGSVGEDLMTGARLSVDPSRASISLTAYDAVVISGSLASRLAASRIRPSQPCPAGRAAAAPAR